MTIYCDESGGLNAGAMTFSAVMLTPAAASAIHTRFRSVTGLRGELKGSRISLVERAWLLELFDRAGGRAWVAVAERDRLAQSPGGRLPSDLELYAALLDLAIGRWLPETGGVCTDVVIDDGRYDPHILARVRAEFRRGSASGAAPRSPTAAAARACRSPMSSPTACSTLPSNRRARAASGRC